MITYCTNIHPGESLDEVFHNVTTHVPDIKKAVSHNSRFPLGLWLSNHASLEIDEMTARKFNEWCLIHNCYVATINGFPYGSFHSSRVKENVYLPDWRSAERVEYTKRLAGFLDACMPQERTGSISTVPIGFKSHISNSDLSLIKRNMIKSLQHLDGLKQKSGKEIVLSLEPEPGCFLETTEEVVKFFEQMEFPDNLRNSIGICFDCCHQAVQFESPEAALSALSLADIRIGKIQVSSALSITNPDYETLVKFDEQRYLHQVVIKSKDNIFTRYNDLSLALNNHRKSPGEEWRIHFHIPVFIENMNNYGTTQSFAKDVISMAEKDIILEVETYTWNVLPVELQLDTINDSIIREITWVKEQLNEKNCCT